MLLADSLALHRHRERRLCELVAGSERTCPRRPAGHLSLPRRAQSLARALLFRVLGQMGTTRVSRTRDLVARTIPYRRRAKRYIVEGYRVPASSRSLTRR